MDVVKQSNWDTLPNKVVIPNAEVIIKIHDKIIKYRIEELEKEDPISIRDQGILDYLCIILRDKMYKYKEDQIENALYVATESFYQIACRHPFIEGNKTTAYVTSLTALELNRTLNFNHIESTIASQIFEVNVHYAPKEAEEITKLAEGGEDEAKIKKLIKQFLEKYIKRNQNEKK